MQRFINAYRICSHQLPARAVPLQDDSPSTKPSTLLNGTVAIQPKSGSGIMWDSSGLLQQPTSAWCSMTRDIGMLSRREVGEDIPKIIIFTDEDRINLPWKPREDDRRCPGAGLRGLDHSFLHDQQWRPGWPPVRNGSAFRCNTSPSCIWNVVLDVLLRQRHVPGDLLLRVWAVQTAGMQCPDP